MRPDISKPVNAKRINPKHIKWMIRTGLIVVLLVAALSVAAAVVLPGYVENHLLPRLGKSVGLNPVDMRVRRIGMWGSDLGPIRLTADGAPAITVAAVQVDYSPWGLIRGKIDGLTIVGLGVPIARTPEGLSIAGIRVPTTASASEDKRAALDLRTLFPIPVGRLAIVQSHLTLEMADRRYAIPFDIELQSHQPDGDHLKGRADLSVSGNPVTLRVSLDPKAGMADFDLEAVGFQLAGLAPLISSPRPVQLEGRVDIQGHVRFGMHPLDLKGLALTCRSPDIRLATPQVRLQPVTDEDGRPQPVVVSMTGDSLSRLKWRLSPFRIMGPVDVAVSELSGILAHAQGRWTLNGEAKTTAAEQSLSDGVRMPSQWDTKWRLTGYRSDAQGLWEFYLTSQDGGPLTVETNDAKLTAEQSTARISGSIKSGFLTAESTLAVKGIRIVSPMGTLMIPEAIFDTAVGLAPSDAGAPATIEIQARLPGIQADKGTTTVRLPETTFKASGKAAPQDPWRFDASLKLSKGRIADKKRRVQIRDLSVDLPLKWPLTEVAPPGRLSAGVVEWNKQSIGGVTGTLQQKGQGLTMALKHGSKLFPGMNVLINCKMNRSGSATIDAEVPPYRMAEAIDLGRFHPAVSGMKVTGKIEAAAQIQVANGRLDGDLRFKFEKGRLRQPSRNLLLEGIDTQIHIDDMQRMQSAPQQRLRVSRVTLGKLEAKNLKVDFRVEPPGTLFFEKVQIDWCQGKINAAAIRIIPGRDEYESILFCDRLNLSMVLKQLGAAEAQGDGTVNGRIPILWTNGRLSFDNGFLYSSPGQTGAIRLSGTQALLSGLPPDSPQHVQLDIATEALKDYTYEWAKLSVQTEDDTLLLKLQFDGKPNRLLPFAYDGQSGRFKRVAGQGLADFKGLSIDLNLRSPLNDILNYKALLK
jgi:hypothetical protein